MGFGVQSALDYLLLLNGVSLTLYDPYGYSPFIPWFSHYCLCGPAVFGFIDYEDDALLVDEIYDYYFLFAQGSTEMLYFSQGNPRSYRWHITTHPHPLPRDLFDVHCAFYVESMEEQEEEHHPWPPV